MQNVVQSISDLNITLTTYNFNKDCAIVNKEIREYTTKDQNLILQILDHLSEKGVNV